MSDLIGNDIIDSRDIIARIDEIETDLEERGESLDLMLEDNDESGAALEFAEIAELESELELLKEFEDAGTPDYQYGEAFISEDYFTDYSKQLCEDIGDVSSDLPSYIEIDWNATAENLKVDYLEVEVNGYTYLARA